MSLLANGPYFETVNFLAFGALSNTITWLELLAIGVFVYDVTGAPFDVAMVILLRID